MNRILRGRNNLHYSVDRLEELHLDLVERTVLLPNLNHLPIECYPTNKGGSSVAISILMKRKSKKIAESSSSTSAFRDLLVKKSTSSSSDDSGIAVADEGLERLENAIMATSLLPPMTPAEHERSVIETIRAIGEVLVNSEVSSVPRSSSSGVAVELRSDEAFEYFCENKILPLLVDIAKERPPSSSDGGDRSRSSIVFHEVVWSSLVKAQILQTVSLLISGVRDASALYFMLSQNCVNELISCMVPLRQWTDPALEVMVPAFVDLLKNLSLQLSASPHLFPFFTVQQPNYDNHVQVPLFLATLHTTQSSYAQSDSFSHATCLNLLVDLLQIDPVRANCLGDIEQAALANHLCQLFMDRYGRFKTLTTGPVINTARCNAIAGQIGGLEDQIDVLNDVFCCGIQSLNVKLCEALLQRFIIPLLKDLLEASSRSLLSTVGVSDSDVIPDVEAHAQAATYVLSKLFQRLSYPPLVRMLAVALFHPRSSPIWTAFDTNEQDKEQYLLTPALNGIITGNSKDSIPNPWRQSLIDIVKGDYGEWRLVPASILLENALSSELLDLDTLAKLEMLPHKHDGPASSPTFTLFEAALESFLSRNHFLQSAVSTISLECAVSLAIKMIHKSVLSLTKTMAEKPSELIKFLSSSPLRRALEKAKRSFFAKTLNSHEIISVADIFVDLIEAAVKSRYKRVTSARLLYSGPAVYACLLSQYGCTAYASNPDVLIRKIRSVDVNDVEATRFNALMAIHFRATCRVLCRFQSKLEKWQPSKSVDKSSPHVQLDMLDMANGLVQIFGVERHDRIGTDVDLRGRMVFHFLTKGNGGSFVPSPQVEGREDLIIRSSTKLLLVLDPTDMLVVKPTKGADVNRGTVVCTIPLLNVIAAAGDEEWLHIAVKHQDVGFLIKNGNMAVHFESGGTCLIVKQYLDRCRQVLRGELMEKIRETFMVDCEEAEAEAGSKSELDKGAAVDETLQSDVTVVEPGTTSV